MVKSLRLFKEEDGRDGRDSRDNSETEYHNFVRDLAVVSFVSVVLKPPPYPSTTTPISCQKGATNFIRSETKFLVRRGQMQRSAKMPPMGSTWRTSHWWHFLLAAADDPLSQEIITLKQ